MPNFSGPGGMKNQSLVAVFKSDKLEEAKGADKKRGVPVNVQVDMTTKTQKALREMASGENGEYAARASLAAQQYEKDGKKLTGYNVFYTPEQVQAMLDAAGPAAATSEKGAVYAPFKADVINKGKGNFAVNTQTIQSPASKKPFDIEKHSKNCKITSEAYSKARAAQKTVEASVPEAAAEVEAEEVIPEA